MKKIIYKILFSSLFIIAIFTTKSFAGSDFTYTLDDYGNATITAYKGTESNLTIPSTIDGYSVVAIGRHAFNENRNDTNGKILTNVIISEGIVKIGDFAFIDCINLASVTVPDSVFDLGFQTFIGCSKLTKINIPLSVRTLQSNVFQDTGFTEFEVPENIEKMDSSFRSCDNLKKVVIYNKNLSYYTTTLMGQVIDYKPFELCPSDLVLYSYKGSTTEEYAKQKGIKFEVLEEESPEIQPGIKLSEHFLDFYLDKNEPQTLTVDFIEIDSSTPLIWLSTDENVAIVENGKVTAKNVGDAEIIVSTEDGKYKDGCSVTVFEKDEIYTPGYGIILNKKELILKENESETLTVDFIEIDSSTPLIWLSTDENVAIVENGKVTAKNVGDVEIIVSTENGEIYDTCAVTVIKDRRSIN